MIDVILLTGTINVQPRKDIAIQNSEVRLKQYLKAIGFYLKENYKVVFVENSGYEDDCLSCIDNPNFEYLTFFSKESELGKGHGEKEIIDFALKESSFLKVIDVFIKITGRLIVCNINKFSNLESTRCHHANLTRNLSWADTRLMLIDKKFYIEYFDPLCTQFLDETNSVFFEHIHAKAILLSVANGYKFNLWPEYPEYEGINGQNGSVLNQSFFKRLKYKVYFIMKKFIINQTI